jgi:hypothetical protein
MASAGGTLVDDRPDVPALGAQFRRDAVKVFGRAAGHFLEDLAFRQQGRFGNDGHRYEDGLKEEDLGVRTPGDLFRVPDGALCQGGAVQGNQDLFVHGGTPLSGLFSRYPG